MSNVIADQDYEQRKQQVMKDLETKSGYDYYEKSLELKAEDRSDEVEQEIKRLSQLTTLTADEMKDLRDNAPPKPQFELKTAEQRRHLGRLKRKSYNDKVEDYNYSIEYWKNSSEGVKYRETKEKIETRAEEEARQRRIAEERRQKEERLKSVMGTDGLPLFTDVRPDPQSMNEAFVRMSIKENLEQESDIGTEELNDAKKSVTSKEYMYKEDALTAYVNGSYEDMNRYLRTGYMPANRQFRYLDLTMLTKTMKKMMNKTSITRDLVVRRGVKGVDALHFMMGGSADKVLSPKEIKEVFRKKLEAGDVFLTDRGFVSTSIEKSSGFPAGEKDAPGIEFIILVKKGTHALDVSRARLLHQDLSENELIIGPGTKFRVVRAFFNDGQDKKQDGDGNDAEKILKGNQKSWKIYLETVPGTDDGVLRN